jgi:heme-degrading monooxygenase HmoA
MFVRLVYAKTEQRESLREWYETVDIPTVKDQRGLRTLMFLESVDDPEDVVSLTIWDSQADAEAYERSGPYQALLKQASPMLSGETALHSYKVTAVHHASG